MDNITTLIESMQSRFPNIYDVYNKNTILYALLSIYASRMNYTTEMIDRLYAMIGIDSTYDEDLEHRWGSLLGLPKLSDETYDDYRSRLMIVYSSLAGGTAESIKYAIASTVGISENKDLIDKYIHIYDAWKYSGSFESIIDKSYGHIVCIVDLIVNENMASMNNKILKSINTSKASGIMPYLFFIYTINELCKIIANDIEDTMAIHDNSADVCTIAVYKNTYLALLNMADVLLNTNSFVLNGEYKTKDIEVLEDFIRYLPIYDDSNIGSDDKYDVINASYISYDWCAVNANDIEDTMAIHDNSADVCTIAVDEMQANGVKCNISHDICSLNRALSTNIWSSFGTNSLILNNDFTTNMLEETDSCIDKINIIRRV